MVMAANRKNKMAEMSPNDLPRYVVSSWIPSGEFMFIPIMTQQVMPAKSADTDLSILTCCSNMTRRYPIQNIKLTTESTSKTLIQQITYILR